MTYPKVSAGGNPVGVPASPRFPEVEERVLGFWAADDTFLASVHNRPAGENGANEFVFTAGRRSRMACRITGTCSPATSRI